MPKPVRLYFAGWIEADTLDNANKLLRYSSHPEAVWETGETMEGAVDELRSCHEGEDWNDGR